MHLFLRCPIEVMSNIKRFLLAMFLIPICYSNFAAAQNIPAKVDSSFKTTYYEQKLTLFESLPDTKGEIIFLGNSITDIGEWAEIFQKKQVKNRGISGDNSYGVLNRLPEVLSSKPAKIFLMIGINDLAQQTPDSLIVGNYLRIVNKIKTASPKTVIYLESVLPTNSDFTEFKRHQNKDEHIRFLNQNLERIAKSEGCIYINLYPYFLDNSGKLDKKYTNDGLHLKAAGYMLWKSILQQKGYM